MKTLLESNGTAPTPSVPPRRDEFPQTAIAATMKKTIYLANAYGFSEQHRRCVLPAFVAKLTQLGATVWEPFSRNDHIDFADADSAYRAGRNNLHAVALADAIFAIVNGNPPDEGRG
ncbi:MAG: nucleoside 2-deoxyribosyltransferase [Gammaproteobacteria bacterium]